MGDSGVAIVGGGLSSARFVKAYREGGGDAPLRLISADTELPYHRPRRHTCGASARPRTPWWRSGIFYDGHGVEVSLARHRGVVLLGSLRLFRYACRGCRGRATR
jgi:hypothetical protein